MNIEKDEWAAWRDNPITMAVFNVFRDEAERLREHWLAHSFGGGGTGDPVRDAILLANMRGQYGAFIEMVEHDYNYLLPEDEK